MASPTRIGRFEIVRELGRGAMGLVYLAHDPKIDRKVAIKTIQRNPAIQESEAEEGKQRFLREAQAAGKLIHPGIVTIFDVGDDQGLSYIAMEYIEGNTLESATKPDHLLPVETTVRMVIQAGQALEYAHEHKIVHRDIKPANLMVIGAKQLKITDFGLAKNPAANLTSAGTLIGTPNYMSPEQIMGRALDGRSDLFSLGVVLYELLTGDRPFGGDTISTIIYKILHEIPKSPEVVNPRVPAALTQVILKAIEKDPAKRFQTGQEFAGALQGYLDSVSPPLLSAQMRASAIREPAPPTVAELPSGAVAAPAPGAARMAAKPAGKKAAAKPAPAAPVKKRSIALPLTLVVLALAAGVAVVFYPRISTALGLSKPSDRKPEGGTGGPGTQEKAAGTAAATGPPAVPDVNLPAPLPAGEVVSIHVQTEPPGGRIFLDKNEVTGGTIVLGKADATPHTLMASNNCLEDQRAVRSTDPDPIVIPLKTPKIARIRVTSDPTGARITLDGHEMADRTPADIGLNECEPHKISARLSGYKDEVRTFPAETVWPSVSPLVLSLSKLPDGTVLVKGPYPLDILEGERPVGASGAPVNLPAGRHTLRFVNSEFFVEVSADVDVIAGETVKPSVSFPGLGQLTVYSNPSNGYVLVDGRKVGALQLIGYQLAEGRHMVKVVLDSGQTDEGAVIVTAGQTKVEKRFPK